MFLNPPTLRYNSRYEQWPVTSPFWRAKTVYSASLDTQGVQAYPHSLLRQSIRKCSKRLYYPILLERMGER